MSISICYNFIKKPIFIYFQVTVSDNGTPNLVYEAKVMVKVTDENDNKPEFTDRLYRIHYPETPHVTEDIPVFQVLSWDDDEGRNSDLTFDIRKGKDDTTIFKIHPKTGFVTATESLVNGDVHHFVVSALTLPSRIFMLSSTHYE